MSIQKQKNGKYRARIVGDDGKERARHFTLRKDAVAWEAQQLALKAQGQWVDPNNKTTFEAYYETWAPRQVWETGTIRAMDLAVRSVTFLRVPIVKVKRAHIETWVRKMNDDGLAPGTIKTRFSNVRNVFRAAARDRVIGTDPSIGVTLPRQRRRESSLKLPTDSELRAVLAECRDHFRAFVAVGAFAGLRLGEACALRPVDIDLDAHTIRVSRQIQRTVGHATEVKAPKFGSERTVYMAAGLAEILRDHMERYEISGLMWMFPGEAEFPLHQNSVGYLWRSACLRAGVVGVRFHDLRHYFASHLIMAGCSVVSVQRALGHSSASTTLNTYSHWFKSEEDRTREATQRMIDALIVGAVWSQPNSGRGTSGNTDDRSAA